MAWVTTVLTTASELLKHFFPMGSSPSKTEYVQDPAVLEQLKAYRQQNEQLSTQITAIRESMKEQNIDSFEALEKVDAKRAQGLVHLAQQAQPIPMQGNNIALFGITSSGKSLLINDLIGADVAAVGEGETTLTITPYKSETGGFTLYDIPGRNDDLSYFSLEYIGFLKGLSQRVILVRSTVKEMTKVLKLLEAMRLPYTIAVNRFETVQKDADAAVVETGEEREAFEAKIQGEVTAEGLTMAGDKVFFVSALHPDKYKEDFHALELRLLGPASA